MKKATFTIFLVLIIDQVVKIWIKTTMMIGEEISLFGNWGFLHFTENNGMAFGMQLEGAWGKLALSLFRLTAIFFIGWYLIHLVRKKSHGGLIITMSLIFAGALGNMIDSAFYGMIFSHSYNQVATLFPPEGGYSSFLHGRVVDMFYFPILKGYYPDWLPFVGGDYFVFFRPVFNIADSAITIGVFSLLLFQKKFFHGKQQKINNSDNTISNLNENPASSPAVEINEY